MSVSQRRIGPAPRRPAAAPIAPRQIYAFVALTFAVTWGLWIPVLLLEPDVGPWALVLGGFGPFFAAACLVRLGGTGVWPWLRGIVVFRVPATRYLAAVGIPVAFVAVQLAVAAVMGTAVVWQDLPSALLAFAAVLLPLALLGGGQEEFGWRGWLQPALQDRWTPLGAAVIVGIVWAAWHAPLFWLYPAYAEVVVVFYVPTIVAWSVIIAVLWNRARQSVIIAIVLHSSFNASGELLVVGEQAVAAEVLFVVQAALAVTTVAAALALVLTHGWQLGRPMRELAATPQD